MNKVDILNRTKDYLLEHGWVQRSFEEEDGRVCIIGALNRSVMGEDVFSMKQEIHFKMIEAHPGGVMSWNDAKGRTFNDVMDFLDEMILKTKEEESSG